MRRDRLLRALSAPGVPAETRVQLHFQLGVSYDQDADTGIQQAIAEAQHHYAEALRLAPEDAPARLQYAFSFGQSVLRNPKRFEADIARARVWLRETIDRFTEGESPEFLAFAHGVLAELDLHGLGTDAAEVEDAIARLESAFRVLERHRDRITGRDLAIFLVRLGRAFEMRQHGTAEANLNAALSAYLRAAAVCGPGEDYEEYAGAIRDAAMLAARSTDIENVRQSLQGLDVLDSQRAPARSPPEQARDLGVRGALCLNAFRLNGDRTDLAAAEAHYRAALAIAEVTDDPTLHVPLLCVFGTVLLLLTPPAPDAEVHLRQAVALADALPDPDGARALARLNLGRFLSRLEWTDEAASLFRQAQTELEAQAGPDGSEPAIADLARNASAPAEALIDTLLRPAEAGALERDGGSVAEALNVLERNKCRALGLSVAAERACRPKRVPVDLWEEYLDTLRTLRRLGIETTVGRLGSGRRTWMSSALSDGRFAKIIDLADLQTRLRDKELGQVRARKDALRSRIEELAPGTSFQAALPTQSAELAARLARAGLAIVHFVTTESATYTFVTTRRGTRVHCAPALTAEALQKLLENTWFGPYRKYREAVESAGTPDTETLKVWRRAVASIGETITRAFRFGSLWQELASGDVAEILFIPYRGLHLVPLHLLCDESGSSLCDRFDISYAPSLAIHAAGTPPGRTRPALGVFVEDPDGSLAFAALDVGMTQAFVEEPLILSGAACRAEDVLAAMRRADLLHFSGHAYLDADMALRSSLRLADRDLSMAEIAGRAELSRCRLVLLSACETAQTSATRHADEYVGLPGAFLRAGARTVVGTLWAVEDAACPIFDHAFCSAMFEDGASPRAAFAMAKERLRKLTLREIPDLLASPDIARLPGAKRLALHARMAPDPDARPFDHPVHWGAFCLIGGRDKGDEA